MRTETLERPIPSINEALIRAPELAGIDSVTLSGTRVLITGRSINHIRMRHRLRELPEFRDDQVYLLTDGNDVDPLIP